MTRVLLTGATGFIGSHVAKRLLREGYIVHALVRRPFAAEEGLTVVTGDLTDRNAVLAAVAQARPEICVHLAWYAAPGKYLHAMENLELVEATLHLARALKDAGCKRLVGAGTCFEYDTTQGYLSEQSDTAPGSLYAASKLGLFHILKELTRLSSMTFAWTRLFYQYGPGEPQGRLVSGLLRALMSGREAQTTLGEQMRDFLHVDDVASAICAVAESDLSGAVNIGSGEPVKVKDLVMTLGRLCGASDRVKLGALAYRVDDPMFVCAQIGKLRSTGWQPRFDLESGLRDTLEAFKLGKVV